MTKEEIHEIEKRALAATPGDMSVRMSLSGHGVVCAESGVNPNGSPWWRNKPVTNIYGYEIRSKAVKEGACAKKVYSGVLTTRLDEEPQLPPDAELMIYARRDILALIAEVRRLKNAIGSIK